MKQQTMNALRSFMRSCQQYWNRQWIVKGGQPHQVSYEQSLQLTVSDLRSTVIDKPNVHFAAPGDTISEQEASIVFNTEFSDSYEECKKRILSGIPYTFIPNGDVVFRNQGFAGIMKAATEITNN